MYETTAFLDLALPYLFVGWILASVVGAVIKFVKAQAPPPSRQDLIQEAVRLDQLKIEQPSGHAVLVRHATAEGITGEGDDLESAVDDLESELERACDRYGRYRYGFALDRVRELRPWGTYHNRWSD
jgi:hypothetical protein